MKAIVVGLVLLVAGTAQAQEVGWNPAISLDVNTIGPRVTEGIVDTNGFVQPTKIQTSTILPAVEAHVFYNCWIIQCGPMAALTLGEGLIAQLHGGLGLDFKGFVIGVGYSVRPNSAVMRSDFVFGQPAPPGATEIAYVEKSTTSVSVVMGFEVPGL